MRAFAVTVALLATNCSPPGPAPGPASVTPAAAPPTLAGEWRVAGIDGREFNEPYGLALSADARRIWWEPICAGFVRGYAIDGAIIAVGPDPDLPPRQAGEPTRPVCTIAPPPRLAEVMRALDSADTIQGTPSNGVELSGGGHSLLLFSQ